MPNKQSLRQGDVLLIPTRKKPTSRAVTVATDAGRVILAYGEVTGHAHQVIGGVLAASAEPDGQIVIVPEDPDPVPAMELFEEPDGSRILVVRRDALVRHQEHAPLVLPPGGYEVRRQREYSPEAIRNVAD